MNNKGFTLIELIAIIALISIIGIIAYPSINVNEKNKQSQKVLEDKIENAAKIYAAKYYADKIVVSVSCFDFTLGDLEKDGLVKVDVAGYYDSDIISFKNNQFKYGESCP